MAHQVFVSHAAEDREIAARVCAMLEAEATGCWMAPRDVGEGTDPAAATLEAIRTSDLVLLIFSARSNSSPYVLREIERAIAYDRPVLSLHIDDSVPNASIEYYLNLWQWLEVRGGVDDKHAEILVAVHRQLTRDQAPTESQERSGPKAVQPGDETGAAAGHGTVRSNNWGRKTWLVAVAAVLVIAAAVVAGTYASNTPDHNFWTKLDPEGAVPQAREHHEMVYDSANGEVILFGGWSGGVALNDTWVYAPTANTWTRLRLSGEVPAGRFGHSMAYDTAKSRVVLFGGTVSFGDSANATGATGGVRNDTWAYNPTTHLWTNLSPQGALPSARLGQTMTYDPVGARVIMFGGFNDKTDLNDTWAYDPRTNTWTELSPQGVLPSARRNQAMTYDPSSGRVIMFGGFNGSDELNDTWAYDPAANAWTNLSPLGTQPPLSWGQSMAVDPSSGRLVMFFGTGSQGTLDTWAYEPRTNTWTQLDPGRTLPPARRDPSTVFDSSSGRFIIFGGGVPTGELGDTWAYTP